MSDGEYRADPNIYAQRPGPHEPNYWVILMDGLYSQYNSAAMQCQAHMDFERAMYYRGKADATREAIQHFRELKP